MSTTYTSADYETAIKARTLPKGRPTIEELEAILAAPDPPAVTIMPDGRVEQHEDVVLAALRIASRVMEEGVIERALKQNVSVSPKTEDVAKAWEMATVARAATIRRALTETPA